jgi:hypothetical protein
MGGRGKEQGSASTWAVLMHQSTWGVGACAVEGCARFHPPKALASLLCGPGSHSGASRPTQRRGARGAGPPSHSRGRHSLAATFQSMPGVVQPARGRRTRASGAAALVKDATTAAGVGGGHLRHCGRPPLALALPVAASLCVRPPNPRRASRTAGVAPRHCVRRAALAHGAVAPALERRQQRDRAGPVQAGAGGGGACWMGRAADGDGALR